MTVDTVQPPHYATTAQPLNLPLPPEVFEVILLLDSIAEALSLEEGLWGQQKHTGRYLQPTGCLCAVGIQKKHPGQHLKPCGCLCAAATAEMCPAAACRLVADGERFRIQVDG